MGQYNYRETARKQGTAFTIQSTGSSVQSTNDLETTFSTDEFTAPTVRLAADGAGYFLFGTNPTAASSTSTFLGDGQDVVMVADPNHKVAWISKTGTTNLNVTQLI